MSRGTFGDEVRFSITVSEVLSDDGNSQRVDVYAAGRWLTCVSNQVFVPFFAGRLQHALGGLLADPAYSRGRPYPESSMADNYRRLRAEEDNMDYLSYRFMDWGPTADNVSVLLFREGGMAYLPFSFVWPDHHLVAERGQVFVAELPVWELAAVLHGAAWELAWDWADRSKWPR